MRNSNGLEIDGEERSKVVTAATSASPLGGISTTSTGPLRGISTASTRPLRGITTS